MARLSVVGLDKRFGDTPVLHGLDFAIEEGEFVALVGPSGCGKSTLLRILAGLDEPSAGEVLIDDEAVNELGPRERNVAMVFQSYALYPHMTVAGNIGFNLRLSGLPKAEIADRVAEVAELLDLGALLERKPAQLSGGQRQRVAMGRALVRRPDVFLFDEPLSNLDAKLRVQMRDEIKRLHARVPTTSVYVTHDQIEAMTLADRVVVLDGGRIRQVGTPMELYAEPADAFVAGFIGTPAMNFLDATLVRAGSRFSVAIEGAGSLPGTRARELPPDGPVLVGLRPEHLRVAGTASSRDGPALGGLRARLELVEPTGAHNLLKLRLAGRSITVVDPTLAPLEPGAEVVLAVRPEHVHVFPVAGRADVPRVA